MREVWPDVRIIFRGASGFCRWKTLRWCDNHNVYYLVGLAKNTRINELAQSLHEKAEDLFEQTGEKQRLFGQVQYAAKTWDQERTVIVKAQHGAQGANPRYVVTNLPREPEEDYGTYCGRGDIENRIKEQQLYLFSDRTSCQLWWPNQFRMMLSSLAYVLMQTIRSRGLQGTEMAHAQCQTIRLKLFKIGAVLTRNTRTIHVHLSSACPYQHLFWLVAVRHMLEHSQEGIDTRAAVESAGLTVRQLNELTQKELGVSPARILEAIRLRTAMCLLRETDYTIDGVASEAGLSSRVQLERIFKRRFEVTPSAWRKAQVDTPSTLLPFLLTDTQTE